MKLHTGICHDAPCTLPLTITDLDLLFMLDWTMFNLCLQLSFLYTTSSRDIAIWWISCYYLFMCLKTAVWMANNIDQDQVTHSAAPDPGHRGVQLILAYNWARPVTLVAGKGRGGMFYFFCFFTFILVRLSYLSLSFISSTISFLPFSGRRHKMTHKGWRVVKPQHNQSMILVYIICLSLSVLILRTDMVM